MWGRVDARRGTRPLLTMSQFLKLVKNYIKARSPRTRPPVHAHTFLMRATVLGLAVLLACGVGVAGEDILGRVALWPGAPKDGLKVCWDGELMSRPVPLVPLAWALCGVFSAAARPTRWEHACALGYARVSCNAPIPRNQRCAPRTTTHPRDSRPAGRRTQVDPPRRSCPPSYLSIGATYTSQAS